MTNNHFIALDAMRNLPDDNCDIFIAMRSLLIDPYDTEPMPELTDPIAIALLPSMRDHIRALYADASTLHHDDDRTTLSMMLLDFTLCPMHAIDYAICFDDDDADCAAIRALFPSHDT